MNAISVNFWLLTDETVKDSKEYECNAWDLITEIIDKAEHTLRIKVEEQAQDRIKFTVYRGWDQDNNFVTEHYIVTQHKAVWLLVLFAMNWERAKSQVSCHRLRQEACRRLGLEPISPEPIFRDRPDSAVRRALAATFNIDVLELPSKSYRELIEDWATVTVR
jgi:hypothetical protein